MGIEKYFETSQTPHLHVEQIHGNLQLAGLGRVADHGER